MQVGLLSDIHGNLPALKAVLEDMPSVDTVVCAGDVVGYNPWPAACVEVVREKVDVTVVGNHDRTVRTPHEYDANPLAAAGLRLANENLSSDQLAWLDELPRKATFANDRFLIVQNKEISI